MITRFQYDWLIANYPHFMQYEWPNMAKHWTINGVVLHHNDDYITVLKHMGRL